MDFMEKPSNEKRLIDANALIKEANADYAYGYVDAKQIADAPTVDAVEVVRCKDCRHMEKSQYGRYCQIWGMYNGHGDDGFCCYGERKGCSD